MIQLSFAQSRLWFLHRFEGPSATYNLPVEVRLEGVLDAGALEAALRDVVVRHESLRTVFVEDEAGVAYQRVVPETELALVMSTREVSPDAEAAAASEAAGHRFDLSREIPVRAVLLRSGPRRHLLVLVMHHIAFDGESMGPLARDLSRAYRARCEGAAPVWDELPVQYTDYTLWQKDLLGDENDPESELASQLAYWRQELEGASQQLVLPTDRPRPPVPGHDGGVLRFAVDAVDRAGVQALAQRTGTSEPMVLQAALAVLLGQLGGGEDVSIGSPIAGRDDEALADLVGFFVNTWVLRVDLSGNPTFEDVLGRVRDKALAAYDNQDAPFERLVEILNPQRSRAYHPLFQVMFAWQDTSQVDVDLPGVTATMEMVASGTAKFDLEFSFGADPSGGGLLCTLEYATELFDRGSAVGFAERFVRVLRGVVGDPGVRVGAVDVLSAGERERLLVGVNDTAVGVPAVSLAGLVERRVEVSPDAVAVVCGGVSWSFREVNERANR
ncbi:condensation domain-containing protein, partial [Streptomyces sp. NPDC005899]|uniref:condensation domain-containing protein n=1 Tax=Streptomyces sp. NPDC005899 TaxID=3155716 RepID=UPI0033E62FAE